ncbi:MAG TPA: HDOD domain-containing protein [Pseudomonadales bacterium]|nr:HDOD domain-containing protein [Pseudomonadales bacterium]
MSNDDLLIRVALLLAVSLAAIALAWRARQYNRRLAPVTRGTGIASAGAAPAPAIPPGTPFRDPMADAMLRELNRCAFGVARFAHALPDEHETMLETLRRAALAPVAEPPALLVPLLAAGGDDAALHGLLDTLRRDPPLAGAVLELAADPAFGHCGEPFTGLEHALEALGAAPLRALIASALLQPAFALPAQPFAAFGRAAWQLGLQSALAAAAFARAGASGDPVAAHVLGLVHALGAVTVFRTALAHYQATPGLAPRAEVFVRLVTERADAAAHALAVAWNLPAGMRSALAEHSAQLAPGAMSAPGRALYAGRLFGLAAVLREHDALDHAGFGELLARKGLDDAHRQWRPSTPGAARQAAR